MAAGKRDIEIVKGDDYLHVITLESASGPINITGRTYEAMMRKSPTQTLADATFVTSVTNAAGGEITVTLSNSTTTALKVGCYYWDLQQNVSGIITTILRGKADVITDVTR